MAKTKVRKPSSTKKVKKQPNYKVEREKGGRGYWAVIRSNTFAELDEIVKEMQKDAMDMGLEQVQVDAMRPSPAGGWEATIRAHNWNPIKSIKRAYESVKQPIQSKVATKSFDRREKKRQEAKWKAQLEQEILSTPETASYYKSLPPDLREKYIDTYATSKRQQFKLEEEAAKYGVPTRAEGRYRRYQVPVRQSDGTVKMEWIEEQSPGRQYSQAELSRKVERARLSAPKSTKRKVAEGLALGTKEALVEGGKFTAAGMSGMTGSMEMGRGPFKRGQQTLGSGPPSSIYRPAPAPTFSGPNPVGGPQWGNELRQAVLPRVGNPLGYTGRRFR